MTEIDAEIRRLRQRITGWRGWLRQRRLQARHAVEQVVHVLLGVDFDTNPENVDTHQARLRASDNDEEP